MIGYFWYEQINFVSENEPYIFAESTELPDKQLYYIKHKRADDQGNRLSGGREFFRSI
jgi:hypothetical protein